MCQWPYLLGNLSSSHHQTTRMASTRQRKKSSHRSRHMLIHFHDNGVVCPSSFGQTCPEDGQWDGGKEGKLTSFCAGKNTYLLSRDGASNQILGQPDGQKSLVCHSLRWANQCLVGKNHFLMFLPLLGCQILKGLPPPC